jgi:hypothetical protein
MKRALVLFSVLCFLVIIALLPLPIPPYLDFQVIYHADMGLLRSIPLYDHAGQVDMIAQLANVSPEQVYVLPFPYPPWYALIALPLALLSIAIAARLWFELNLIMLLACVALMTEGWQPLKRILTGLAAFFFLPVLGTLLVGQYVFPVLLGAVLWIYAAGKEKPFLIAIASALLTFKPHLGALILLAGFTHLILRRDLFGRRALTYTIITGVILFAIGFLADPAWPLNYLHSLLTFRQDAGVASCGLCASLSVAIVGIFNGEAGLSSASVIGLAIFTALSLWWLFTRRAMFNHPEWLLAIAILVTLLSSPYLLNYDFVLLLLPLFFLTGRDCTWKEWVIIAAAYLIPFIALGIWGRQGNFAFSLSAFILLVMLHRETRQLDVSRHAAYNPTTIK